VAANILRDFLADTFSRLQRSTTDLDTASGELNAIATLMAQGTREQFSRTDQVATAMHEMSATAQEAARHAARAGEQGRGFAVVADEVRTLAQRTAESTAEIHQIIDTVQTGAVNAVRAIESGQQRSEEGVTQVTEAGATLQLITGAVEAIRDMNRQIATAAEEQTSVAEDISRNLTEITAIATANQENVQRTESAGQNLHKLSGQLSEVTQRLSA
jgi:methyl-accepting chemotaxis protein